MLRDRRPQLWRQAQFKPDGLVRNREVVGPQPLVLHDLVREECFGPQQYAVHDTRSLHRLGSGA
ncbi:MAG: hypothetical protein QOE58_1941 [Actinomycetota bacterium]|jgi:hypothetical protein|nr:hypothetical protein [Actinomycetota bacterium]